MLKNITSNAYYAGVEDSKITCNCINNAIAVYLMPSGRGNIQINKSDSSANAVTILGERNLPLINSTLQVETATVVGTVTASGLATVVLTSADIDSVTLSVPVLIDDTATMVATRIVNAMKLNSYIAHAKTGFYTVSNSGAVITLTKVYATANDSTLNISIDNGTCTGLTTAASSANTTTGVAITVSKEASYKTYSNDGTGWLLVDVGGVSETETLVNKTLTAPVINAATHGSWSTSTITVSTNEDKTLSASQRATDVIVLAGGTGAFNVIFNVDTVKMYLVNNTTSYVATCKNASGTTTAIPAGTCGIVHNDGTNMLPIYGSALTLTGTQTATNKTLTTPVIASLFQDAGKTLTVTMPAATDTLVGKATADTLTNKTLDSQGTGNHLKNIVMAYCARVTTAEINAGKTLVAAVAGRTIRVLRYSLVVNGAFDGGGGTSVILQDDNGTPVVVSTFAKAALTAGAKIASGSVIANVTDGAGMVGNLTAAKGLVIPADAAISGGTSIDFTVYYMYV